MSRFLPTWLTAHRAILLGLAVLAVCAFGVSALDADFTPRPDALLYSLLIAVSVTGAVSALGAAAVRVAPNSDSWLITALILFFVLPGATDAGTAVTMVVGSAAAAASKYVLAWRRKLIVNPAVVGAVLCYGLAYADVGSMAYPTWWIAAESMLLPMIVLGVLMVTATAGWRLAATFLVASAVTILVVAAVDSGGELSMWLVSSPMFFVAAVMLPEPLSSPATAGHRMIYGVLVAVLMYWQQTFEITDSFALEFTPEIALLVGCLYAFVVGLVRGSHRRVALDVINVDEVAENTYSLRLRPVGSGPRFRPGQWASLSAPHWSRPVWGRSRRVFSFAGAPGSGTVEFGFTTAGEPSPYKKDLIDGRVTRVHIDNQGGDFVLDDGADRHVLLASGIGITPFLSMIASTSAASGGLDKVTLVHVVRNERRRSYAAELDGARRAGATIVTVVSATAADGRFDEAQLAQIFGSDPDASGLDDAERGARADYYVSGNPAFVSATASAIRHHDRHARRDPRRIRTDVFLGY